MVYEFERIREKTGIDKLDKQQRKKLFQEFITHGGEIIDEKNKPGSEIIRGSQLSGPRQLKSPSRPEEAPRKSRTIPKKATVKRIIITPQSSDAEKAAQKQADIKKKKTKISDLTRIYTKGLLLNVFTFGGKKFAGKFIKSLNKEVKDSFINLDISLGSILKGNYSIREDINRLSVGENSIYYEMLFRISALYDEKEFNSIAAIISNRTIPKSAYVELFKHYFKRMYILGQYKDVCKFYISKSIDIQGKRKKIDQDIIPTVKNQLKKDLDYILGEFLEKFHIILCKLNRTYYPLYSQELDDFLEITEKDKIGYITRIEKKNREEELKKRQAELKRMQSEAERKDGEIKIPKHVMRGFQLIEKEVTMYEEVLQMRGDTALRGMNKDDKMYKSIVLFNIFEDQYSFILTTSKIAFNIDYKDQKKVDIKKDLNHAYFMMSETREDVKNYIDIVSEIKKTGENLRLTSYQKSSLLDSLSKKQPVSSGKCRRKIADVMKGIERTLSVVISDYNSANRLLQNPDDHIYFDKSIDGVKILHGKKNIEAVLEAFLFAATVAFMLNYGDLSGSGLLIEKNETDREYSQAQ